MTEDASTTAARVKEQFTAEWDGSVHSAFELGARLIGPVYYEQGQRERDAELRRHIKARVAMNSAYQRSGMIPVSVVLALLGEPTKDTA